MAEEKKLQTKDEAAAVKAKLFADPELLGDSNAHLLASPHDLSDDINVDWAGDYELTHGQIRLPERDEKGDFKPRGRVYKTGARLRLGAIDAFRFMTAGVVKRIDGKKPNKIEPLDGTV